jgi:hypothetical protein
MDIVQHFGVLLVDKVVPVQYTTIISKSSHWANNMTMILKSHQLAKRASRVMHDGTFSTKGLID